MTNNKIKKQQIIYSKVTESVDKNPPKRIQVIIGYCHPEFNIEENGYSVEYRFFNTIERAEMFIESYLTTFYQYNYQRAFLFIDGTWKRNYKLVGSIDNPSVKLDCTSYISDFRQLEWLSQNEWVADTIKMILK